MQGTRSWILASNGKYGEQHTQVMSSNSTDTLGHMLFRLLFQFCKYMGTSITQSPEYCCLGIKHLQSINQFTQAAITYLSIKFEYTVDSRLGP